MVYYTFIKRFDLDDEDKLVVCKDGNGRNIKPSNLSLLTRTERTLSIIRRKRHENVLLRPGVREKATIAYRKKYGKQISRYDTTGKIIESYPSVPEAAGSMKISKSTIFNVLWGRKVTAAGFFWRFGAVQKIDIQTFLADRKSKSKSFIGKQVTQYNMKGERIAVYRSLSEASRKTGVVATGIGKVTRGNRKSAGGFFWAAGNGKKNINLAGYRAGKGSGSVLKRKKVSQYTSTGKFIARYPSLTAAARQMGLSAGGLCAACKGSQKTFRGFSWKYD
ncbi:MAG: NUMOD1 domain-containing DNA-binding protein [Puia sp.]|nr:NUMOD1 domain-containing DNA-binding protein [Puia sp.]